MGALYMCSSCCLVLSIWAVIQTLIMGVAYKMEVTVLVEDVMPHDSIGPDGIDYDTLIKLISENFAATAINCWIVSGIYAMTLLVSCIGLCIAKKREKKAAVRREDDEYSCKSNKFM